jgi:hypothetical protein
MLKTDWDIYDRKTIYVIECDTCPEKAINKVSALSDDEVIDKAIKKFWKRQAGRKSSDPMKWVCPECQKKALQNQQK